MIEPLPAMYAAVEAVGSGVVGEVELEWFDELLDGSERRLTITVRREVKHFVSSPPSNE